MKGYIFMFGFLTLNLLKMSSALKSSFCQTSKYLLLYEKRSGCQMYIILFVRACFQISEGSSFGVREFLEEFLSKWNCVDERYYVLVGAEANVDCMARSDRRFILGVDNYLEVVEVYAVTLLATVLHDMHLALSWVEKAALPEEKRQVYVLLCI
jgi:hypothetical protein